MIHELLTNWYLRISIFLHIYSERYFIYCNILQYVIIYFAVNPDMYLRTYLFTYIKIEEKTGKNIE